MPDCLQKKPSIVKSFINAAREVSGKLKAVAAISGGGNLREEDVPQDDPQNDTNVAQSSQFLGPTVDILDPAARMTKHSYQS
jgi:hypothetical protein